MGPSTDCGVAKQPDILSFWPVRNYHLDILCMKQMKTQTIKRPLGYAVEGSELIISESSCGGFTLVLFYQALCSVYIQAQAFNLS